MNLRRYNSVSSTMDIAADAIEAGAPEWVVIVADEQTAGRGRRGRTWVSPPGTGLYLSFVLRPILNPVNFGRLLSLITLTAGVAVHEAISRVTGLVPELKWPNDLMVGRRKVAGILAEGHAIGTPRQAVALGVGVNVLCSPYPPEIADRATSLEAEVKGPIDRAALLDEIVATVPRWYQRLDDGDADGVLRAWRAAAPSAYGARVTLNDHGLTGVTAGVDDDGALLIDVDGRVERVISGDLQWL